MDTHSKTATPLHEKKIAFITKALRKTKNAHVLVTLAAHLVERGWQITIITSEAQTGVDYLLPLGVRRISLVGKLHGIGYRQAELQRLSKTLDVSAFIFWNWNTTRIQTDYEAIKDSGKAIYLSYFDSLTQTLLAERVNTFRALETVRRSAFAVTTPFPLDELLGTLRKETGRTVCIPYLFPYEKGDLRPATLVEDKIMVFVNSDDYQISTLLHAMKRLLTTHPQVQMFMVEHEARMEDEVKEMLLQRTTEMGLDDSVIWLGRIPKPHKLMNNITCCIFPEKSRQYPALLSEAVCRGIPAIVLKESADYEPLYASGYARINGDNSRTLAAELQRLMDETYRTEKSQIALSVMEPAYVEPIIDRWEQVLQGSIPAPLVLADRDKAMACAHNNHDELLRASVEFWSEAAEFNRSRWVRLAKWYVETCKNFRENKSFWAKALRAPRTLYRMAKRNFRIRENRIIFGTSDIFIPDHTRRKLQLLILKMYIEFDRVCRENNLRYYLAAGSILGAVRHRGFIPWDDDMDVTMPRKDYDKFLEIANSKVGEEFYLNKNAYPYCFSRLEIKGTRETAPLQRNGRHIFLDILPLDCAAPTEKKQIKHDKVNKKLIFFMFDKARRLPTLRWKNKRAYARRIILKLFYPQWWLLFRWEHNARKYYSDDATHWVCLPGAYGYEGEKFPAEYWGEPVLLDFEGIKIPSMRHWHDYLVEHYGDYMQPIPKAHRRLQHRIFSIHLGKYEPMSVQDVERDVERFYESIHRHPLRLSSDLKKS